MWNLRKNLESARIQGKDLRHGIDTGYGLCVSNHTMGSPRRPLTLARVGPHDIEKI